MTFRILLVAAFAAIASIGVAMPAYAEPATATTTVNVRSGPGTQYSVVDVLQRGERVEVIQCRGSWCEVDKRGRDGWVSSNYLTSADRRGPGRDRDRNDRIDEEDIGFCIDAPNFQFGINCDREDDRPVRPGRPERPDYARSEVCFYSDANFRGSSFCARPGQSDRSLSREWNDRISSIEIKGRASAVVCKDFYMRGSCAKVDRSISRLGPRENDTISSYRVER